MNREEIYYRSVDVLVKAYLNDTLEHGNTCACAVGNLIAANTGRTLVPPVVPPKYTQLYIWSDGTALPKWFEEMRCNAMSDEARQQISSTGYSVREVIEIEQAFEGAHPQYPTNDYVFNSLMSVIDCLDKIHENTDTIISTAAKKKFDKSLSLAP